MGVCLFKEMVTSFRFYRLTSVRKDFHLDMGHAGAYRYLVSSGTGYLVWGHVMARILGGHDLFGSGQWVPEH